MTEGVKNFLHGLGLIKYYRIFSAKGFDLETDIPHLSNSDLKDTLMVSCEKEREIILSGAQKFKASPQHHVYEWLRRHSLDHYLINFIQSELLDLEAVSKINLPNEDLYDELEIVLPGHKKRLERAVLNLRQEILRRSVAEKPVIQGWWGKPECLPQAKFDFLCVEGSLFAKHEPEKHVKIDFMVDSGSDVSTVQEDTLKGLNLEVVGPIYSCGIHGGNHTNLYRAQLQIGNEQMAVEVIASNYDSLGSRVVRHFRHVIDGNRHIWLKGNYKDPHPAILPLKIPNSQSNRQQILSIEDKESLSVPSSIDSHPHDQTAPPSASKNENAEPRHALPSPHPPNPAAFFSPNQPIRKEANAHSPPHTKEMSDPKLDIPHKQQPPSENSNNSTHDKPPYYSIVKAHDQLSTELEDVQQSRYNYNRDTANKAVPKSLPPNQTTHLISNNFHNAESRIFQSSSSLLCQESDTAMNVGIKRMCDQLSDDSNDSKIMKMDKSISPNPELTSIDLNHTPLQPECLSHDTSDYSIISMSNSKPPVSIYRSNSDGTHLPKNQISTSQLRDTDDDIDHMDSEIFHGKYTSHLSSSSLSLSTYNAGSHTSSSIRQQQGNSFKQDDNAKPSDFYVSHEAADNVTRIKDFTSDVIHIDNNNDGDDDDNDSDNGFTSEVKSCQELGSNFVPGSNTSSVTISIVDLNKRFEMNGENN